jgi:hypothetical protein
LRPFLRDGGKSAFKNLPCAYCLGMEPLFKGKTMGNRHPCLFKETDIARAFRGARRAGVTARIDIAPDGTMRISQLTPQEAVNAPAPPPETEWDRALGKPPA